MKIFIWKSYGDIEIYAFDTKEQQLALKPQLIEALVYQGRDVNINSPWRLIIDTIDDEVRSRSDSFEYDTRMTTLKDLTK